MREQNKETILQLKELVLNLQKITNSMRNQYRTLSFLANAEMLCILFILVFIALSNRFLREFDSVFSAVILLLIVDIVTIINYIRLHKQGMSFHKKYQEGRKILQTMADKAEWTRYKKRLIYRGNDKETSRAVDNFFNISEREWSPCRSEKRYHAFLVLTVPTFVLCSFIAFIVKVIIGI